MNNNTNNNKNKNSGSSSSSSNGERFVLFKRPKTSNYNEFFDNNTLSNQPGITVQERRIILPPKK